MADVEPREERVFTFGPPRETVALELTFADPTLPQDRFPGVLTGSVVVFMIPGDVPAEATAIVRAVAPEYEPQTIVFAVGHLLEPKIMRLRPWVKAFHSRGTTPCMQQAAWLRDLPNPDHPELLAANWVSLAGVPGIVGDRARCGHCERSVGLDDLFLEVVDDSARVAEQGVF